MACRLTFLKKIWTIYFYIHQISDGLYASVKEPPQLYDVPKDQPLIDFGATGGQTYDNKDGQVYDNKGKHILSCFYSVARAYFITFIDGHYTCWTANTLILEMLENTF